MKFNPTFQEAREQSFRHMMGLESILRQIEDPQDLTPEQKEQIESMIGAVQSSLGWVGFRMTNADVTKMS